MDVNTIRSFAQENLQKLLGAERATRVAVDVGRENDGTEFLDITVYADHLPSAADSISATRKLRHSLSAQGEHRFPNVVYVSTAEAA